MEGSCCHFQLWMNIGAFLVVCFLLNLCWLWCYILYFTNSHPFDCIIYSWPLPRQLAANGSAAEKSGYYIRKRSEKHGGNIFWEKFLQDVCRKDKTKPVFSQRNNLVKHWEKIYLFKSSSFQINYSYKVLESFQKQVSALYENWFSILYQEVLTTFRWFDDF